MNREKNVFFTYARMVKQVRCDPQATRPFMRMGLFSVSARPGGCNLLCRRAKFKLVEYGQSKFAIQNVSLPE